MALIHVYNGIHDKTSYTFNGTLRDNLSDIDWDNTVILRGGRRISPDYELDPNDIIYVRKTPAALTTVLIVATAATLVIGGVALGVSMYKQRKELEEMQEEQEKATAASKAGAEASGVLPNIKGARNQPATGRTFPYIIGKSLMALYTLCPGHYTIAGENGSEQYFNVVLQAGFNNLVIDSIKMGETVIKDFTGAAAPQSGVYQWDAGLYYDERNVIEIRQTGAFSNDDFNKKILTTMLNKEIPHEHANGNDPEIETEWRAGVVQELPSNAMGCEVIALFDGLQKYTDEGTWDSQTIELSLQWTNVNNPQEDDWHDFTFDRGSNVFTYNTKKQMRFAANVTFTAEQAYNKTMKIRARRLTPKAESAAKDTVYLMAVQTTCYDAKTSSSSALYAADVLEERDRDKCCRIGIRVAANTNTKGQLDAFSIIASGTARTWNGSAWSEGKSATSNAAAWALELLTSPHHAPSRYDDSELDLDSFGAWYEYCEAQGFNADGVISRSTKKKSLLETICSNTNTALFYNPMTGKMEAAINNGRDYSVALLNSENIISISTTKEFKLKTDGRKVTYINAAAGYITDSVIFMRDGEAYDPASDTLTENALDLVTNYAHAFKIAWRQMAEELAQPRVITVRAGYESAYYPLFSRVELQHKTLKIGLAHGVIRALVWRNSYLQQIILDGSVTFPEATACGVIINCASATGRGLVALKVSGTGTTDTLDVETTLRSNAEVIPTAGDLLSFGELDDDGEFSLITSSMLITNTEEADNGYTLTLVDYNPDLYTYGALPEYKSNATTAPNGTALTVEEQRPYVTEGDVEATTSGAVQAAVDTIHHGYRFTNVYKVRPVDTTLEEIIAKIDDDARNSSASIQMSETEILLQVQDMERELVGLISVQAGAVAALVEGGGASGQMSLSLELPVMIDATKRAQLIAASTEDKVNAVYALVENTDYYGIKGNVSNAAVKALWDDAVAAGLIASQVVLSADQINIAGKTIYTSSKTDAVSAADAAAAQAAAISAAATDATTKADAAQAAAAADATSKRNDVAQKLGYTDWAEMETAAANGQTIIDGGYLRTELIEVEDLLAKNITLQAEGYMKSSNYAEAADGTPTAGFKIDAANNVIKSYNMLANGGTYKNITADELLVRNGLRLATVVGGDQLSGLVSTLYAAISNYPKRPAGENTYTAAGYAEYNAETVNFSFTAISYELVWSGNTINGILIRGFGMYNDTDVSLWVIRNLQIMPSGTSYIGLRGGTMKPLPAETHSVLYI